MIVVFGFLAEDRGTARAEGRMLRAGADGGRISPAALALGGFGGFHRHLVRQLGHSDGFRHMHFQHAVLDGRIEDAKTVVGALVCDAVAHRLEAEA